MFTVSGVVVGVGAEIVIITGCLLLSYHQHHHHYYYYYYYSPVHLEVSPHQHLHVMSDNNWLHSPLLPPPPPLLLLLLLTCTP